jgi:hypothetical protein
MAMKRTVCRRFTLFAIAFAMTACSYQQPEVYRGYELVKEGPLGVNDHYEFRFVNRWRISFDWLSGPVEIRPCDIGAGNPFRRLKGYKGHEALAVETSPPIFEINGIVFVSGSDIKSERLRLHREDHHFYGNYRNGPFEGYSAFCSHLFRDTYDAVSVELIKPDPAKGTDAWIDNSYPVTLNGLHWLKKTEPIQDLTGSKTNLHAPIETWVLKIPNTVYWLVFRLNGNSGTTSQFYRGAFWFPEKHHQIVDLFHQMVNSVRLEPVEPVDITPLITPSDLTR